MATATCASCGAEIPDRYRRCGACATLREVDAAPAEIRRIATVVNSDLKGSTALGERLDPETLREVLTLYFDEMRAVFESHGGTIEKIIGDAIVAVFGLPVRHDDDPLRAVEAAAESQRALAVLNDALEARWGVRLVVRTGVATGEVLFGEASAGQHVLTGSTMTISSALEQNSPPLEVLIAESTYEQVRAFVTVEPVEPITPKGSTEVVDAYRLVSVESRPRATTDAAATEAAAGMRLCPACGDENPDFFAYCGTCGASLVAAAPARESRKTVTLVFADPKPMTTDGSPPSPEALRDIMPRYFEAMRVALELHGGTVEKFIGDAVMAVFGLPVRHEDDAVRAIRAAAGMQAALPALNEQFRADWGIELQNHIGVNTGEVITGDAALGQRLVTGDAVNTAARLEQAAGPQEIILGGLTYRLARDQVEADPIPPLTLKGKAEPVAAFRLVTVLGPNAERAGLTTPFVGRRAEMDHLEITLLEVEATRSCELITVVGEAGVGKSRLIREFATRATARDRAQVLRGRCLPYGDGVTFWPIAEIVRNAGGINDEDPLEVAVAKIVDIARATTGRGDDPTEIAARVAAAIGLTPTQYPSSELFWGIRRLLEAIAGRRPLVAIVDDIHVAAPTFLELLDHLLDAVRGSPILLLTTARHELLEARAEWAEAHEAERIELNPLSGEDADAILHELLGGLDASVRARIVGAAEGNPLYVEQITSMLVETGALRREGETWVATVASGDLEIPPTISALIAARLDALSFEERRVIDPASVIGLGFAVDAVSHLVPEEAVAEVPTELRVLSAKQLVRPTVSEEDFYRFGHSVIKDTAYRTLLKRTRADLHERFVDWAEPINRERGRELEFEEILGYHLEQAYRYRTELGPVDQTVAEVGRRASAKLASAGRRAFVRGDASTAASLIGRATDVLPETDSVRIELLAEQAEADIERGEYETARQVLDEQAELSARVASARLAARGALVRYQLGFNTSGSAGDPSVVVPTVQDMLPLFEGEDDLAGQARALRLLYVIYGTSGDHDRAAEAASKVVAIASSIGDARLAARGAVAYSQAALASSIRVQDALRRCEDVATAVAGDRIAEARFLGILAVLNAMQGLFTEARDLYGRSQAIATELGTSVTAAAASIESSRVEMLAGNPAGAERELRRDYETLAAVGEQYYRSSVAGLLSHALVAVERWDEAETFVAVAEELSDPDDQFSDVIWRTAKAKTLAHRGAFDEARALVDRALEEINPSDVEQRADALVDLAAIVAPVDPAEAQAHLQEALALYEQKGDIASARAVQTRITLAAPTGRR